MTDDQAGDPLYWDSSYAIAIRLMEEHPTVDVNDVSLGLLAEWTMALPEFADDPELINDDLLQAILQEWYEEATSV
jgi:FeS assembly protein IscX